MEEDNISIEKLKEVFTYSTGKRTIEVTEKEYQQLLDEAQEKNLEISNQTPDSFSLKLGELSISIICEPDEDEEMDADDEDVE